VLGLQRFTELDERYAYAAIVERWSEHGAKAGSHTQPGALAHILLGALVRGGMLIASSPEPRTTRDEVSATMRECSRTRHTSGEGKDFDFDVDSGR